ncbi:hypothetical protein [Pimelobacter simplex]|uniref:hypothetical protein n=1 Tax=Nocardioides simplex TaxID=2045 RepID=UPI00214FD112|nr:hypothetical protein [Pimelobacter simplex]UUW92253.1 hypothetical protein M0M43_12455 [Pimelobacter simplex]UUW96080.1 hypothetical protein M0M48_01085 [Pimelobacter simplex]
MSAASVPRARLADVSEVASFDRVRRHDETANPGPLAEQIKLDGPADGALQVVAINCLDQASS